MSDNYVPVHYHILDRGTYIKVSATVSSDIIVFIVYRRDSICVVSLESIPDIGSHMMDKISTARSWHTMIQTHFSPSLILYNIISPAGF